MPKKFNPSEEDRQLIIEKYRNRVAGDIIAKEFNVSSPTIYNLLRDNGIVVSRSSNFKTHAIPKITVKPDKSKAYYVYIHKRLDNGVIFYVGKGTGLRYREGGKHKTKNWKVIELEAGGYVSEIIADNLSSEQARDKEIELINNPPLAWKLINVCKQDKVKTIPIDELSKLIEYSEDSPSGLKWINGNNSFGKSLRKAGDVAGGVRGNYWVLEYKGIAYSNHRIIVRLHGVDIPEGFVVNHIDHDGFNNNMGNLEVITQRQNSRKTKITLGNQLAFNNSSGYTGIKTAIRKNDVYVYTVKWIDINGNHRRKLFSSLGCNKDIALELAVDFNKEIRKKEYDGLD